MEYWDIGILRYWNFEILKFEILKFDIFEYIDIEILIYENINLYGYWNIEIFAFWNIWILKYLDIEKNNVKMLFINTYSGDYITHICENTLVISLFLFDPVAIFKIFVCLSIHLNAWNVILRYQIHLILYQWSYM